MRSSRHRFLLLFAVAAALAGFVAPTGPAVAATVAVDSAESCRAVEPATANGQLIAPAVRLRTTPDHADPVAPSVVVVSPTAFDVTRSLRAGDAFTCILSIRNRRKVRTTYEITALGLLGDRSQGTRLIGAEDEAARATAATWVDPAVGTVTLRPNQVADVPIRVTVPPNPPRGGVFAMVQVLSAQPAGAEQPAAVGVTTGAGVPLLLRVGGAGAPKLAFDDPRAPTLRVNRAHWTWRARVDNDGTEHAVPRGRVRIRSIFGSTVATFPIATRTLLPGGGAKVDVTWKQTPWFGVYRYDARVDARGADDGTSARAQGWIVALPPWWVITLIGVVALAAIVVPIYRRRDYRRYLAEVEHELFDEDQVEPERPPRID